MDSSEYKKRFDKLRGNLLGTCDTFYSWKSLQNEDYQPIYDRAKYFWGAVLFALQNEWLLSLAKCFENSKHSKRGEVISVYALLKHHPDPARREQGENLLERHSKVIDSISRLRNHQLAHLNAKHLADPSLLLKKFPINYGEVEGLFNDFPGLLSLLNPEPDVWYMLDNFTKTPEFEAMHMMKKIQFFDEKEKEHIGRFIAGEINDPHFPPPEIR
jgi:hypothetical protein